MTRVTVQGLEEAAYVAEKMNRRRWGVRVAMEVEAPTREQAWERAEILLEQHPQLGAQVMAVTSEPIES